MESNQTKEVRSIRVTDETWDKFNELADSLNLKKSNLFEKFVEEPFKSLFSAIQNGTLNEKTELTGTELARRLKVSSAAITPFIHEKERLRSWSEKRDPQGIPWERLPNKKYRPILIQKEINEEHNNEK